MCDEVVQPNGSRNPQTITSDLALWLRQSGIVQKKPSYLLRRLNRGPNHTLVSVPKRITLVKTCVIPGKLQLVLSLGA